MKLTTNQLVTFLFVVMPMVFAGCTGSDPSPASNSDSANAAESTQKPSNELIAGQWCYEFKSESLTLTAVMEYDGKNKVFGDLYGDIQDKSEGYFTTYNTSFEGIREGGNLKVKSKTEIEGDVQEENEIWAWDGKTLIEGQHNMKQVDCEPSPEE